VLPTFSEQRREGDRMQKEGKGGKNYKPLNNLFTQIATERTRRIERRVRQQFIHTDCDGEDKEEGEK
jgi:hypothetical protein